MLVFTLLLGITSIIHHYSEMVNSEASQEICDNNPLDIEFEQEIEFDDEVDKITIKDYLFFIEINSHSLCHKNESAINFHTDTSAQPPEQNS